MDYYTLLDLEREPFSNSPDPDFFYATAQHASCLQQLEIALRLRRGLNVVLGEVGLGKTTLCRRLLCDLARDEGVDAHLILDPALPSAEAMLAMLDEMLSGAPPVGGPKRSLGAAQLKERIKRRLFRLAVDQERIVVLLVDEAQEISPACLEILRELLNYETNEHKLLQIVLFGQPELADLLARQENVADRVNLFLRLAPLSQRETRDLILFRLAQARRQNPARPALRFSFGAMRAIQAVTGGYPRRIVTLCHRLVLALIVAGSARVTPRLVRSASLGMPPASEARLKRERPRRMLAAAACIVLIVLLALAAEPVMRQTIATDTLIQHWTGPTSIRAAIRKDAS
ncbi:ExeA family protein [Desulfocurvibacter africanus]|uniref:Type II secretory pathway component ExeA (Predicted ATPase)-like protein n=1 Tax=Desulfocurvibacter africanus subsp. africanus str. Walvis Bay TaxID=690850 RepID=F3YUZ1_DESAF|nr:AAA family ATPase [Desulfocurvibacter africanus]EGJ49241.1 type II secretory pathway component ExeA (predicted ATPase)-like protein [Desulfocurvibacter africanus subsp. africanus str. Walvis Bay]